MCVRACVCDDQWGTHFPDVLISFTPCCVSLAVAKIGRAVPSLLAKSRIVPHDSGLNGVSFSFATYFKRLVQMARALFHALPDCLELKQMMRVSGDRDKAYLVD